jgi:hypothetical protein
LDFTIACPMCAVASDIADVPMRLMPPEGWHDESPTAALALRVAAAVRSDRGGPCREPAPLDDRLDPPHLVGAGRALERVLKARHPNGTGRSRSRIFPTGLKLDSVSYTQIKLTSSNGAEALIEDVSGQF